MLTISEHIPKVYLLLLHPEHFCDLVCCALKSHRLGQTSVLIGNVTLQTVTILELIHHLTLFIIYFTVRNIMFVCNIQVPSSWARLILIADIFIRQQDS